MDSKELSEKIKNELTMDQVNDLLIAFGGNPMMKGELIVSQTICHGGSSHKLYYYDNTKLFKCYTDCLDSFDIFELVIKINKVSGIEMSLPQAVNFVINFYNLQILTNDFTNEQENFQDWKILNKYEKNSSQKNKEKIVELKYFNENILEYLPQPRIVSWEKEGITPEVLKHNHICYDPVNQGIVIPHYDIEEKLLGIRERTLIKENEDNGKYKPAFLNYQLYNHPLGFNLYNINNSKNNIVNMKKAIVFEGEKSCLLYQSYFGIDNDISVAVCGSSFTSYQVELLNSLGVDEIIIAFDKQFKNIGDNEWKVWTKKLQSIALKFGGFIQISFIFDKWDLLGYKDSPIDCGKDIFLELFKRRVEV